MTAAAQARSASIRASTSGRDERAEVVAAELAGVVIQVAEEIHVLERRAQAPCAFDELGGGLSGRRFAGVHECLKAHQPHHLRRSVDVLVVRGPVVVAVVMSVRIEAKKGRMRSSPIPHSLAVRANAWTTRFALKPRSIAASVSASSSSSTRRSAVGVEAGGRGGSVHDLIRDPHQGVDVAHVRAHPRAEHPARQGERSGVRRDDGGRGILRRSIVEFQAASGRRTSASRSRHALRDGMRELSHERARGGGQRGVGCRVPRFCEGPIDEREQPRACTALVESLLRLADGDGPVCATARASLTRFHIGGLARECDQRRALGLAEIAAGRATRLIGGTERADEVVRELEGQPQVAARALEGRDDLGGCPGEDGPGAQGRA